METLGRHLKIVSLVCPRCETNLQQSHQRLTCPRCDEHWPIINGVPHFIQEFPYWGEMPIDSMREVLRRAEQQSWREVLLHSPDPAVQRVVEMLLNIGRANWHLLVDLPASSHVLDIGAGMGTNAHGLAQRFAEVVAVEPVLEHIRFMQLRFAHEQLSNVKIIRSSIWQLPFAPATFDLIALNGVLAWVAKDSDNNPAQSQRQALRRTAELLREGGYLYLGIENRLGHAYFTGAKDPYCGLPYVTLLPRLLAHWYARQHGRRGYNNYLYSAWGYRRLLQRSGFAEVSIFNVLPSYNRPRYIIPLESSIHTYFTEIFDSSSLNSLRRLLHHLDVFHLRKYTEYAFIILAKKAG